MRPKSHQTVKTYLTALSIYWHPITTTKRKKKIKIWQINFDLLKTKIKEIRIKMMRDKPGRCWGHQQGKVERESWRRKKRAEQGKLHLGMKRRRRICLGNLWFFYGLLPCLDTPLLQKVSIFINQMYIFCSKKIYMILFDQLVCYFSCSFQFQPGFFFYNEKKKKVLIFPRATRIGNLT